MSGIDNKSASRMKNAEDRLARAIERLETALDAQRASSASAPPLNPDWADELSRLQTENVELRALVGRASERLDGTIAKLKTRIAG